MAIRVQAPGQPAWTAAGSSAWHAVLAKGGLSMSCVGSNLEVERKIACETRRCLCGSAPTLGGARQLAALAVAGKSSPAWRISGALCGLGGSVFGSMTLLYGGRLAYRRNIGSFFSDIASGRVHGWRWIAFALLGTWVGLLLRPVFKLRGSTCAHRARARGWSAHCRRFRAACPRRHAFVTFAYQLDAQETTFREATVGRSSFEFRSDRQSGNKRWGIPIGRSVRNR